MSERKKQQRTEAAAMQRREKTVGVDLEIKQGEHDGETFFVRSLPDGYDVEGLLESDSHPSASAPPKQYVTHAHPRPTSSYR